MRAKLYKQKVGAVTLLELLIVMAAGSIIFASAAKCYEIVFKHTTVIRGVLNTMEEAQRLHYMMERDVFRAGLITSPDESILALSSDTLPVQYEFKDSLVLRRLPARLDTFRVKAGKPEIKRLELPGATEPGPVSKITFGAVVLGKEEKFMYKKSYSTETLLNLIQEEQP